MDLLDFYANLEAEEKVKISVSASAASDMLNNKQPITQEFEDDDDSEPIVNTDAHNANNINNINNRSLNSTQELDEEEMKEILRAMATEGGGSSSPSPSTTAVEITTRVKRSLSEGDSSSSLSSASTQALSPSQLRSMIPPPVAVAPLSLSDSANASSSAQQPPPAKKQRVLPTFMLPEQTQRLLEQQKARERRQLKETLQHQSQEEADNTDAVSAKTISAYGKFREILSPPTPSPSSSRVVVFDLETTGFGQNDTVIELGAVELRASNTTPSTFIRTGRLYHSYFCPPAGIRSHPMAEQAHGLSASFLSDQPPLSQHLEDFMKWIGTEDDDDAAILVGHNVSFDVRFLAKELSRRSMLPEAHNRFFCTQKYFRSKYPEKSYSLDSVAEHFKLQEMLALRRTHGALLDAEITARVFLALLNV